MDSNQCANEAWMKYVWSPPGRTGANGKYH
jgi:hypothetical protein